MYIDALIELTFAESCLMFKTDDLYSIMNSSRTMHETNPIVFELERLGDMYKEGLLTDEEFAAMKKKLIDGD